VDKLNYINIIALGSWNKKIFTPNWVSANVFMNTSSEKIEGMFNQEEIEIGYIFKGVLLLPKDSMIEIKVEGDNLSNAENALIFLSRIMTALPHTPIKAIGVNFNYTVTDDTAPILKNYRDWKNNVTFDDLSLGKLTLVKSENGFMLSSIIEDRVDETNVLFNFHFNGSNIFMNNIETLNGIIQKYLK